MDVIEVEGATGYIDTNFEGKADACIKAFEKNDLVYLHIEAPDECGHRGEVQNKVRAIEIIDEKVLGPCKEALDKYGEYRIMILPDHPTPLNIKTHTSVPVPYLIYDNENKINGVEVFSEANAKATGNYLDKGYMLMDNLLGK